jgi:hypothetical protein
LVSLEPKPLTRNVILRRSYGTTCHQNKSSRTTIENYNEDVTQLITILPRIFGRQRKERKSHGWKLEIVNCVRVAKQPRHEASTQPGLAYKRWNRPL